MSWTGQSSVQPANPSDFEALTLKASVRRIGPVNGRKLTHFRQTFHIGGATIDIIQAEGLPSGKVSIFITIRVNAAICPQARASQPDKRTLHRPPVVGEDRG
jgi:hypothetical protein